MDFEPVPAGVHADSLCPRGSHDHCDAVWNTLCGCYAIATLAPAQTADSPDVNAPAEEEPAEPAAAGKDGQADLEAFGGAD